MDGAPGPFLDGFVDTFINILRGGYDNLSDQLYELFSMLAGIGLMLSAFWWTVGQYRGMFVGFLWSMLHLFMWSWLFFSFAFVTQAFIDFSVWAGLEIGGAVSGGQITPAEFQRPSTVIDKGFVAVKPIKDFIQHHTGWGAIFNIHNLLLLLLVWLVVQSAFIVMGLYLAFAQIFLYAMTALMLVFMIFGVLTQTAFLAERAVGLFIASTARLAVAAMMTGVMFPLVQQFFLPVGDVEANPDFVQVVWLLVATVFMLMLTVLGPAVVHKFMAGGPVLSLGNLVPGVSEARSLGRVA